MRICSVPRHPHHRHFITLFIGHLHQQSAHRTLRYHNATKSVIVRSGYCESAYIINVEWRPAITHLLVSIASICAFFIFAPPLVFRNLLPASGRCPGWTHPSPTNKIYPHSSEHHSMEQPTTEPVQNSPSTANDEHSKKNIEKDVANEQHINGHDPLDSELALRWAEDNNQIWNTYGASHTAPNPHRTTPTEALV